jgi:ornithine carbamoyltransferase
MKNFLSIDDISSQEFTDILDISHRIKQAMKSGQPEAPSLQGKVMAMIFESPSTRTRVSFDVGMRQLGGEALMLTGSEMQLGRGETIADTARVLSRYVDIIMIRILDDEALRELAEFATVPVINGLTRETHPTQLAADILTYHEHKGDIAGATIAWTGPYNNVLASWIHAAKRLDFNLQIACPAELSVPDDLRSWIKSTNAGVTISTSPDDAVTGADCVVTDCWISMGDADGDRDNLLRRYQVNETLMARANKDAIFMHCLPAHREEEVTTAVMDGPQSVVFDEAENRLHAHKGIIKWCLEE